jgi:hypothetical protein
VGLDFCTGFKTSQNIAKLHFGRFTTEKLSDNDRQPQARLRRLFSPCLSFLTPHGESPLAVHHPSRWLANLASDCMFHHRFGVDH